MATLTVRDAARRLGVKPRKVRLMISEHKLTGRVAPPAAGQHGPDRVVLDADEVETLAQIRAHKRRLRGRAGPADGPAPAKPSEASGRIEPLSGDVESAAVPVDAAGRRTVALVQSMLAPLVAELHDARETIRRQAEELGALRTTIVELERRIAPGAAAPGPPPDGARPDGEAPASAYPLAQGAGSVPAHVPGSPRSGRQVPLWRRVVTHVLTS